MYTFFLFPCVNEEVSGYLTVKTAYFPISFTSHPNAGVKI
jgi:hypothetical protein